MKCEAINSNKVNFLSHWKTKMFKSPIVTRGKWSATSLSAQSWIIITRLINSENQQCVCPAGSWYFWCSSVGRGFQSGTEPSLHTGPGEGGCHFIFHHENRPRSISSSSVYQQLVEVPLGKMLMLCCVHIHLLEGSHNEYQLTQGGEGQNTSEGYFWNLGEILIFLSLCIKHI